MDSIESEITGLQDEIDRKNEVMSELRSKLQGKSAEVSQLMVCRLITHMHPCIHMHIHREKERKK